MAKNQGEFTIDVMLFEPDNLSIEIDFYAEPEYSNPDSDWETKSYVEIYDYRVYSGSCEIELDFDEDYLYHLLHKELRNKEIEKYCR